jgi:ER lumen protein retaining receptor
MNIFRLVGDLSHLLAILILLTKIWKTRSCSGISGKSQILFALVFITRYLDLFTHFISLYNTVMKIFYLASSIGTVYLMYFKFKPTYDRQHDTFRIEFLLAPCAILALIVNHDFEVLEVSFFLNFFICNRKKIKCFKYRFQAFSRRNDCQH